MKKTEKAMLEKMTPEQRHRYKKAKRENYTGRFCPCSKPATAWSNGYVCDQCRGWERDMEFTMANPPIHKKRILEHVADTYTVHLRLS